MTDPTSCCSAKDDYCERCDLLVGLEGLRVVAVEQDQGALTVTVESPPGLMGCRRCGVVARGHGRRPVRLIDALSAGRPVTILWRKRRWVCMEPSCPVRAFTEHDEQVAAPRALLTTRACWWAIGQVRREHDSVTGLARQLGTAWHTVWDSIRPILTAAAADEARFAGVTTLGVDEHVWHHASERKHGPKFLTAMVDLSRKQPRAQHRPAPRPSPGPFRSGLRTWLTARSEDFRDWIQVATLDPFHGYKNAIDDHLGDAVAVLDAFHVVKPDGQATDDVRRRVQQETTRSPRPRGDPLYGIRNVHRCGQERLTDRQRARIDTAIDADERHEEVHLAWQATQLLRVRTRPPISPPGGESPNEP